MKRRKARRPEVSVRDVCAAMDDLAPRGLAYPWDKAGLNIGEMESRVSTVLVALTVTREAFKTAGTAGAQMIVSHHPLIWDPLSVLRTDDVATRLCLDLAHAGIACFSAHTNLDIAPGGVNDVLARRIGLAETRPLLETPHIRQIKLVTFVPEAHLAAVRSAVCGAGAGIIGDYSCCSFSASGVGTFLPGERTRPFSGQKHHVNEEPERRFEVLVPKALLPRVLDALFSAHPYEEVAYDVVPIENQDPRMGLGRLGQLPKAIPLGHFAAHVRAVLDAPSLRFTGSPNLRVRTVGVLGGSGGAEIKNMPQGIDVLVTGDVRYHDVLNARRTGLALIDAGHAATEKWIVPVVARYLRAKLVLQVTTCREPDWFRIPLERTRRHA